LRWNALPLHVFIPEPTVESNSYEFVIPLQLFGDQFVQNNGQNNGTFKHDGFSGDLFHFQNLLTEVLDLLLQRQRADCISVIAVVVVAAAANVTVANIVSVVFFGVAAAISIRFDLELGGDGVCEPAHHAPRPPNNSAQTHGDSARATFLAGSNKGA